MKVLPRGVDAVEGRPLISGLWKENIRTIIECISLYCSMTFGVLFCGWDLFCFDVLRQDLTM